ncbi:hypothetical protein BSLG_006891 [Batrachochytrium salamandrivorans]|nr:hypothetical protein BSLG_006891 [Batrachochytrium salamandrivorans]
MNSPNAVGLIEHLFQDSSFSDSTDYTTTGPRAMASTTASWKRTPLYKRPSSSASGSVNSHLILQTPKGTALWTQLPRTEPSRNTMKHRSWSQHHTHAHHHQQQQQQQHQHESSPPFPHEFIRLVPYRPRVPLSTGCRHWNQTLCASLHDLRFTVLAHVPVSTRVSVTGEHVRHGGVLQLDVEVVAAKWLGNGLY